MRLDAGHGRHPYIGTVLTTLDPGTAYQAQTKTEQSLDTHGNVIWTKVYNYGDLSTPARTYNHTYLSGSDYTSRFIFNLVAASTVTPAGGAPVSILTNYYDTQTGACYPSWTHPANVTEWDPAYVGWAARFRGNVTLQQTASGSSCTVRDDTGAVIRKVDGAGRIVSSTMAAANNYAVPSVITGGGVTNNFTYASFLSITSVTEPNGSASLPAPTTPRRAPTETTWPHGTQTTAPATPAATPPPTATTEGHWVKTSYDGLGRHVKVERGDGTNQSQSHSVVDPSTASAPAHPWASSSGFQPYAPGGSIFWTTYTYDGLGRMLTVVAPDGARTDQFLTRAAPHRHRPGRQVEEVHHGRLRQPRAGHRTQPRRRGVRDLLHLRAFNHLVGVLMPRNGNTQTRTFTYRPMGRLRPPTRKTARAPTPITAMTR